MDLGTSRSDDRTGQENPTQNVVGKEGGPKVPGILTSEVVAELISAPVLRPATRKSLMEVLSSKRALETDRNNAANILVDQGATPAELTEIHVLLSASVADPTESMTWREYSIQHLARLALLGTKSGEIITLLVDIAQEKSTSTMGCSALLQVCRLQQEGLPMPASLNIDEPLMRMAFDPAMPIPNRVTAIGLIGERGSSGANAQLRDGTASRVPAIRRTCIAALGKTGAETDIALIQASISDNSDRILVMTADAAIAALRGRAGKTRGKNEQSF